jgi:hypothetical protein
MAKFRPQGLEQGLRGMKPLQHGCSRGFVFYLECLLNAGVDSGHRFLQGDSMRRLQKISDIS